MFGTGNPRKIAPYGAWKSPITSDLIVAGSIGLSEIAIDGEAIYWLEGRPAENGRNALVRWTASGGQEEMTSAGYNIRTRVHEYGGGHFAVHDETIYFSNFVDQRLYVQQPFAEPEPLTAAEKYRFADAFVDPRRRRLLAIREDHTQSGREAVNSLVSIDLDDQNSAGEVLVAGADFYASPALSPDGGQLAWLSWNHPQMPWDGTELWVGELDEQGSAVRNPRRVAGGATESIYQPAWSPDGTLYFISDRSNWWNIYRLRGEKMEAVCPLEAEFGRPQWVFGSATYAFIDAQTMLCSYAREGMQYLARLDLTGGGLQNIRLPFTSINQVRVGEGFAVFFAGSAVHSGSIVRLDLQTEQLLILKKATDLTVDKTYLSVPQPIEFPTENGLTAHGFYYPPQNDDFGAPVTEKPPLLVFSHGGPTGATSTVLNLGLQYWTSRGFAVVDVNYGGSTGYGRDYRQRLYGNWGVVDVQDCINAAKHLVAQGWVDENRLAIRGGSAGGYTTLCALTFYDTFNAGASYFGVSDIEALAKETHKFESRYLDQMIGPYPETADLYRERSPIHFIDRINCPLILFQGLEDRVVPPNQAEMMYRALKEKGVPVAYLPFAGEQHGFRQAENIKRALDGEFYFYSRIFDFKPADFIKPVIIDNL